MCSTWQVGWNNPDVPWSTLEAVLSGRNGVSLSGGPEADGGDSPAWSRKRDRYAPPPPRQARSRASGCPTPSCTPTPTSASSTAPARPRSSSRRPSGSGWTRWRSPTTTACTAWSASPRPRPSSGCRHGVRRRALARACPPPQNGAGRPGRRHPPARCSPAIPTGYRALCRAISAAQLRGGEKGRPVYDLDELTALADGPLARAHRLPQGRGPRRRSTALRTAATRRARCDELVERFGRDNVAVELTHAGLTRSTTSATTRWPRSPPTRACPIVATTAAHYARSRPPSARHGAGRGARPAQPRRDRRLAAAGGHRPPALRRRDGRPLRPLPGRGGAGGAARARSARSRLAADRARPAAVPGAAGQTEMTLPARAHLARARPRRYGSRARVPRGRTT